MAYGNWGAFVHKNGKRMQNYEDQTPYREEELQSGYHQAFGGSESGDIGVHHAVLGEGDVRLCGYKCYPVLFLRGKEVDLEPFRVEGDEDDDIRGYSGEIEEFKFHINTEMNFVELILDTPSGNHWASRCGFEYGAGHNDD